MEIAIFSDLHLGIKNDSADWHQIAYNFIDEMILTLKKKKIEHIFFLGDWFHNRNNISVTTLHASTIILDKLTDFKVFIFAGNHDLFFSNDIDVASISFFKGYPNITYIDTITKLELDNTSITLCPWGLDPLDVTIESTDYLFGHLEINTFMMSSETNLCEDGYKLSDLLKKYNKIFSGHFHKVQKRVYTNGLIQYVGNPFQQNYGDAGDDKGFTILNLATGKYKLYQNTVCPKFVKLKLSTLILEDFDNIHKLINNNFLRLEIDKNVTQEDISELVQLLSLSKPLECDIDWDNTFSQSVNSETDFMTLELLTAIVEFTKLIDVDNQKEIITYLTKLYKKVTNT